MADDVASPWVDLLGQLDSIAPGVGVWKNADAALDGNGDIDYFAPRSTWPAIAATFRSWSESHGFECMPPCLHRPGALYLIAIDRRGRRLMQLDVRERLTLAGSEMMDASELGTLLQEGRYGFKQLRPGAEATLKLMVKCIDPRGRLRAECLEEESVSAGIGADLASARQASSLLRHGRHEADRLVLSIASGHPDSVAARSLMRGVRMAAFLHPWRVARLVWYRLRRKWCPTLAWILAQGQQVPPHLDRWVDDVRRVHHNADSWLELAHLGMPSGAAKGLFLVVAGPDGVGKSTLREGLAESLRRHHPVWSGRLSGPLSEFRRGTRPGESRTRPVIAGGGISTVRIVYLFVDALLRWLTWTRSWLKRGGWVITERGWWDIAVYPSRYRIGRAGRVHRALGMVGPRPDLILVMETAAEEVHSRKDELSESEIRYQTDLWRSVIPKNQPRVFLDASLPPRALVQRALEVIEETRPTSVHLASGQ